MYDVEIHTGEGHDKLRWMRIFSSTKLDDALQYAHGMARPIRVGRSTFTPEVRVLGGEIVIDQFGGEIELNLRGTPKQESVETVLDAISAQLTPWEKRAIIEAIS